MQKILLYLAMISCSFISCRVEEVEEPNNQVATSTDLIDITGIYEGDDNVFTIDPMGGGTSNLSDAYLKVDSINPNAYSFQVFRDSLCTDTIWTKGFSTIDEPITQCNNYLHTLYMTNKQLRLLNCDSIIFSDSEMIGHSTTGRSFLGKKMN